MSTMTINGRIEPLPDDPDALLIDVVRGTLELTGTKLVCGAGVCGACTVHQGSEAVRSCQIPLAQAHGKSYLTIEGLSAAGDHRCQRAWIEEDVAQCGYCQTGMIMTAAALLRRTAQPTDAEIDAAMSGSVCRCGTYNRVRRAIHRAASEKRTG
jgi:isoquinoline 1-oxidoreductase subunit alpha